MNSLTAGVKADHLRRHVVDQHRPIDPDLIQMLEKRLRRAAVLRNPVEVLARFLHQRQRFRLEQFDRLDVNVAVGDHK
jgi:hypothetical protein